MQMTEEEHPFSRVRALLGEEGLARLTAAKVLVVGVGGVGGWCAEALARTGVGALTIMDDDVVMPSNLNRQCPATQAMLGRPKVEAMRVRLAAVNPECRVTALAERLTAEHPLLDALNDYDVVVDAIDSVMDKTALIVCATSCGVPIVSSMGAARRLDPTCVRIDPFEKVTGDGLARAVRQCFKMSGVPVPRGFPCVWSKEAPSGEGDVKGSLMTVTATFGMCLAAHVIKILQAGA